ncbi:MAG TPA: FAD:protein FMN transferase [Limnobacter sp.]|nr:FAD:protein FMN transferase [Limnobacter sp.]
MSQVQKLGGQTMGTGWAVHCAADSPLNTLKLQERLQARLDEICGQMSHWQADSNLAQFNHAEKNTWQNLPRDFCDVLHCALRAAHHSQGAYNPALGQLVNLWGFGPKKRYDSTAFLYPLENEICNALLHCDYSRIELDIICCQARKPEHILLDFSSIAKGYAVDALAVCLREQNIVHFLIEIGGELRGEGFKPDGQPWWVALEIPANASGNSYQALEGTLVALHEQSMATSGNYRHGYSRGGRWLSHTLDPRTGQPLNNGVASVTVIHSSCMVADVMSTAIMVLGPERGIEYARNNQIAAHMVCNTGSQWKEICSPALLEMCQ